MDDSRDRSGKGASGGRPSLVERAAAKIVGDAGSATPAPAKAPAPSQEGDAEAPSTNSASVDSPAASLAAAVEPIHPEPPVGQTPDPEVSEEAGPSKPTQGATHLDEAIRHSLPQAQPEADGAQVRPRRRRSRLVKVDVAALEAKDMLTPLTKRNRTLEEFRLIKRMLLSRRWDHGEAPGNTIVVTSALPSEGKTSTAINLAMSIAAEEDVRVLLVDADFIKPDALLRLGVQAGRGLIDVIQDPNLDISDVMLKTDIEKLSLIPAGQLHDRCTELLASSRMDDLISELAARYNDRIIIFDSPPVLATTESVALASHMGQVVFVVQAGRTKRESVQSALELLGERQNVGLVLNLTTGAFGKTEFGAYYGSYYYGYGYGSSSKS